MVFVAIDADSLPTRRAATRKTMRGVAPTWPPLVVSYAAVISDGLRFGGTVETGSHSLCQEVCQDPFGYWIAAGAVTGDALANLELAEDDLSLFQRQAEDGRVDRA